MKRSYSLVAVALFALGVAIAWQSSRANDNDKKPSEIENAEISVVVDLLERIEALESRVASLERPENLVRQADSRESMDANQSDRLVPVPKPSEIERSTDDDEAQQTNGQRWQFRLLGNRKTETSLIR